MHPRMKNPLFVLPETLNGLISAGSAADVDGLPDTTIKLVHLRASQINGCSVCTDIVSVLIWPAKPPAGIRVTCPIAAIPFSFSPEIKSNSVVRQTSRS